MIEQTPERALLSQPIRQAPIAVVFIALRFLRGLGAVQIGIAVVFLVSGRLPATLLAVVAVASVVGLVAMILAWWRFTFVIDGDELLVSKGVLAQERLTIPLDRVQSVSISQSFLHRFVGVVSAAVDTAGSSTAEFQIDAIDRRQAEALQRLVAGQQRREVAARADGSVGGPHMAPPAAPDQLIVHRNFGQLVKIGATRWPWAGLVALAPLFAIADDLRELVPVDLVDEEDLLPGELPEEFGPTLLFYGALALLAFLILGALAGLILQVAREVVTNWDMKLIRTETGLRRTAGLFSTTSKASTLNRIQAVQTDQTPAQAFFGIRKLTLPTIGEGDLGVPGASDDEVATLRTILFAQRLAADEQQGARGSDTATPDTSDQAVSVPPPALDRRISRLAIFLAVRNTALLAAPLTALAVSQLGWWGLLVLAMVPIQWLAARRRWRLRRWSLSSWRLAESYEFVSKHTAELDLIKAQTVSVTRSFFERRRGLATVRIQTAEGHLAVPLIAVEEANSVRDRVLFAAESDRRSWM